MEAMKNLELFRKKILELKEFLSLFFIKFNF